MGGVTYNLFLRCGTYTFPLGIVLSLVETRITYTLSTMNTNCAYCPKHLKLQSADTPTECTISNGQSCLACVRHSRLRAQREETKKLLDKLIVAEHEARNEVNRHHGPIHQLPPEIVSHIFHFTLPDFAFSDGYVKSSPGRFPPQELTELSLQWVWYKISAVSNRDDGSLLFC